MLRILHKMLKILFFRETVRFVDPPALVYLLTMAKRRRGDRTSVFTKKLKTCEKDGKILQISSSNLFPTPTEIFEAEIVFVLIVNHL